MKKSCNKRLRKIFALCAAALFLSAAALFCIYGLYVPKKYVKEIEHAADEFGIERELAFAIVRAESNFDVSAQSRRGAIGLMQLMPSTVDFIVHASALDADPCSAEGNARLGCWYMAYLFNKFSALEEALAAYNAGEGTVRGWLARADCTDADGKLIFIPYPETRAYVSRVKKFYKCYNFFYI